MENPARKKSVQSSAFRRKTRCFACFSDNARTSRLQGYLYLGVSTGHCSRQQISGKNEGVLFGGVPIYGVLR